MRRIIATILAIVLVLGVSPFAYAAAIEDLFSEGGYPTQLDLLVDSDIAVREKGGEYETGPVTVETTNASSEEFDFKATLYMKQVRDAFKLYMTSGRYLCDGDAALLEKLANMRVEGQFTVTIEWPNELEVPAYIYESGVLRGFNEPTAHVFGEVGRVVTVGTDTTVMEITIDVVGPEKLGYVTASELENNLEEYFPDLTLACQSITAKDFGTYTIYGAITGYTNIMTPAGTIKSVVNYNATQQDNGDIGIETNDMAGTIILKQKKDDGGNSKPSNPSGPSYPTTRPVTLYFDFNGLDHTEDPVSSTVAFEYNLDNVVVPERPGYSFAGWYLEPQCATPADNPILVAVDTTVYAKWVRTEVPDVFTEDHKVYIIGYPEGDVRPEANITRDEVATIFYRLFKDGHRDEIFTSDNNYTDVPKSWWANKAVSSISKGGYMNGYEDGSFRPATPITRAEFATVATRFYNATEGKDLFSDTEGHWAEEYIKKAAALGLINGYEDGTFRPDAYITRAEAMTIFNRILVRYVNDGGLHPDAVKWPDNPVDAWYYYEVMEATNSHTYERTEDGYHETWTSIPTNWVWLEKAKYEDPDPVE